MNKVTNYLAKLLFLLSDVNKSKLERGTGSEEVITSVRR